MKREWNHNGLVCTSHIGLTRHGAARCHPHYTSVHIYYIFKTFSIPSWNTGIFTMTRLLYNHVFICILNFHYKNIIFIINSLSNFEFLADSKIWNALNFVKIILKYVVFKNKTFLILNITPILINIRTIKCINNELGI